MNQKNTVAGPSWNIFACELRNILNRHGLTWEHLNSRAGINREKVFRLIESLETPPELPILDAEELEEVIDALRLDAQDTLALDAALDASVIQRMLCLLIDQESAGLAAKQLFPIVLKALVEHPELRPSTKRGDGDTREDNRLDYVLGKARNAIDTGQELLYLSQNMLSSSKRIEKAREAEATFLEVTQSLERARGNTQQYQYYVEEAKKGLRSARKRLRDLGV